MFFSNFLHFCNYIQSSNCDLKFCQNTMYRKSKKSIFLKKFHENLREICEISGSQINYCYSSTTSLHPHPGVSCLQPRMLQVQDPCQRVHRAPRSASEYPRLFTRLRLHLPTGSLHRRPLQGRLNPPRPHMEANPHPLRTLAYLYLQIMAFRLPGKAFFILQGLHL